MSCKLARKELNRLTDIHLDSTRRWKFDHGLYNYQLRLKELRAVSSLKVFALILKRARGINRQHPTNAIDQYYCRSNKKAFGIALLAYSAFILNTRSIDYN